jgi:sterol desaturase/sphingolipid hydroxylase (fatty acid hydroxylase superfamily)
MNFINPFSVPDPTVYVIPLFILFVVVEIWILTKQHHKTYDGSEAIASISMGVGVVFVNIVSKAFYITLFFIVYKYRLFDSLGPETFDGFFNLTWHKEHWYAWVLLFFADDFTFYWCHRFMHEVRVFWAGHVNHHSSQEYNFATALRQGWWEDVFKYVFWIWLPIVGFHPIMIFFMMQFSLIYQFFIHTELVGKLGFLEKFMNTPSHHRVHHSSDLHYLDKNYAGVLIIWDKMFGSFEEETFKPKYGLTVNIDTKNPLKIASHEIIALSKDVAKAKSWNDKFKYLMLGPGWTHDGEDKRAKILQKKL